MEKDTRKVDVLRNKKLYKIFLLILRYIPILIGFCYMLNTILYFFGIDLMFISVLSGTSILTLMFLIIVSFVFKFCLYHRIFLYYVATIDIINWIDFIYVIPTSTAYLLTIESILAGITIIIAIISYVENNKRSFTTDN